MERERHLAAGRESRSTTKPSRRTLRIPTVSELGRENPFSFVFCMNICVCVLMFICIAFCFCVCTFSRSCDQNKYFVCVCICDFVFICIGVFICIWSVFVPVPVLVIRTGQIKGKLLVLATTTVLLQHGIQVQAARVWDWNRLFGIRNVEIWLKWGSIPAVFLGSEM